jgi:hypothetical protein
MANNRGRNSRGKSNRRLASADEKTRKRVAREGGIASGVARRNNKS